MRCTLDEKGHALQFLKVVPFFPCKYWCSHTSGAVEKKDWESAEEQEINGRLSAGTQISTGSGIPATVILIFHHY
jgi:hypothetical protein